MNYNLAQPFYESAHRYPDRAAIHAHEGELSYRDVLGRVRSVAAWLRDQGTAPKRVGILASRSAEACIGILAAAWIGAAYVPINLSFPETALIAVLKRSGLDALIADKEGSRLLTAEAMSACPQIVLARRTGGPGSSSHRIFTEYSDLNASSAATEPEQVDKDAPGYILYTSGSTGDPKGVIVSAGAVEHLLRVLDSSYALRAEDRLAETAATSFDISVYNMFAAWRAGASLHILSSKQIMAPANFIREHQITVWLSVPSVATLMSRMKQLRRGLFPSLRQTFFCGEPLLGSIAAEWQKAAPHSTVTNMYGPTEATVMCTGEHFGPSTTGTRDIVPIGRPFVGMKAAVATPDLQWAASETPGELLLAGPQLALGYLDDPEKTRSRFIYIDGERWYRTGDLVQQDADGLLHFLGRLDNQIKVRGYRVELEEIEFHLRSVTRCESVAVPWPVQDGTPWGIVAFLAGFNGATAEVKESLKQRLPAYLVPMHIRTLPRLPMNTNGKVDRKALMELAASDQPDLREAISKTFD